MTTDRVELSAGTITLRGAEAELFGVLESAFLAYAAKVNAESVLAAGLLSRGLLESIDYFRNFPHLGLGTYAFVDEAKKALAAGESLDEVGSKGGSWAPTEDFLPSATCYSVFATLSGQDFDGPHHFTAVGRCFRNEDGYEGLRRLHTFTMREVIFVGQAEGADAFRADAREWVLNLAASWGLDLNVKVASDPFYLQHSRAALTMLDPVKWEFLTTDDTAIASTNKHRNFFGERLGFRVGGEYGVTSCLAFGVERWVHALTRVHGSAEEALNAKPSDWP